MPASRRPLPHRKLWDIPPRFHCSVIGTCLTVTDLRGLCRRAGIRLDTPVSDYDLHHAFVGLAEQACYATRLVQRRLDSRHRATLRRFAEVRDTTELAALWATVAATGELGGAYWSVMSHPLATPAVCDQAASEVHMASHRALVSRDVLHREVQQLRERHRSLERSLHEARLAAAERQALVQSLRARAAAAAPLEADVIRLRARLKQLEDGEALLLARVRNEDLAATLAQARLAGERHAAAAHAQATRCQALEQTAARLMQELANVHAERDGLEQMLQTITRPCQTNCTTDCPRFDLCQRRILYVGGRPALSPHLRQLVERANGEFLHHDGGREDADGALAALVPRVDAVLCPADCISHSAMMRIKRICKRQTKPFLVLRSASLSAFVHGLQQLLGGSCPPRFDSRTT